MTQMPHVFYTTPTLTWSKSKSKGTYETRTLLGSGVSRCRTCVVFETDTTPTVVMIFFKLLDVSAFHGRGSNICKKG